MLSAHTVSKPETHRTTFSFIVGPEPDLWLHPFFNPPSMFVFAPQRRKLRARRPPAWRARAAAYAATLAADDYLEATREALRAGDDSVARDALSVLRGIVEVMTGQLHGSSSQDLPDTLQ